MRLEFERSKVILARVLPAPPARVIDVGGAAGAYSAWLAAQGYDLSSVTVRLLRLTEAGNQLVATQQATLGGDTPDATVVFDGLLPEEPGSYTYRIEVEPPTGEPNVEERHAARSPPPMKTMSSP